MLPLTFKKTERLCHRSLIGELFDKGVSFFEFPFKIIYLQLDAKDSLAAEIPAQVLFTVPKRNHKKAVARNRIKRLMREAYRLNKAELYTALQSENKQLVLVFIYTNREMPEYRQAERKIKQAIHRLIHDITKKTSS
ncbi:MAG: ribonuclease P protein component [Clostridia bacterium]|nr:ribonuclease P protein component [Clostridia bacterium]